MVLAAQYAYTLYTRISYEWLLCLSIMLYTYIYTNDLDMIIQTGGGVGLYRIEFTNNAHAFAYIHT